MWNFAKFDTAPLNSPLNLFSTFCHPKTVKHRNENPLSCHPFPPKLLPTCGNIGLPSHLHTPLSPHLPQLRLSCASVAPCRIRPPSPKSHVIPPEPHSPTAQKPRNINDPISKPETPSGELRAKLPGSTRVRPPGGRRWAAGPGRATHSHKPRPIRGRRGACGAWPGFEPTRRARLAARTVSGQAGPTALGTPAAQPAETPAARQHRRHDKPGGGTPPPGLYTRLTFP